MSTIYSSSLSNDDGVERQVRALLSRMTLVEKIGQMSQVNAGDGDPINQLGWAIRDGRIGSILNEVNRDCVNELQRIAVEESRLGIPLLVGRDVIHGFNTVLPIPLGPTSRRREAGSSALNAAKASRSAGRFFCDDTLPR